jgi:hypothetical protein
LPTPTFYAYNIVGGTVNERSGPGTSYSIVGTLSNGASIDIVCQTSGTSVGSPPSIVWDQLTNGAYVSDWYTNTPAMYTFSSNIPMCQGSGGSVGNADLGASIASIAEGQNGYLPNSDCPTLYSSSYCGNWCAIFVIWVWSQAGANTSGLNADVSSFENNPNVQWHSPSGYTPQPGDAVIWADSSGAVQHVGIVTGYGGSLNSEYSVNGNWQDFYSQGQVIWDEEAHSINSGREGNYSDADINSYNDWHVAGYATPE